MATLVPVAGSAAPGLLGPDETPLRRPRIPRSRGRVVRRSRSASRHALLTTAADLVTVGVVAVLLSVTAVPLRPAAVAGLVVVWIVLLVVTHGYDPIAARGSRGRVAAALRAGAAMGLVCWAVPVVADLPATPPQLMMMTLALTSLALTNRLTVDAWAMRADEARGGTPIVVAGDVDGVARAVSELRRSPGRWNVVSACLLEPPDESRLDVPVVVGVDDLPGVVAAAGAEAVLLLPCRLLDPVRLRRLAWQLEASSTRLYVGTGLLDVMPSRASVVCVGDLGLVQLRPAPSRGLARTLKQVVERLVALVALLLLAPLLAMVAIAVRRDSAGPAIFRQRRIGRDGTEFTMYKFRTMTTDAESRVADLADSNEADGAFLFKIRQDPRITRLGAVLRRYSVDELPQLVNVALGDMSLVGPRPALPDEVARYDLDPRRRLAVRPGLTGLWQVSGRSDLSWDETVRLDLHYVDNWSVGLDMQILCRTARAVLGHDGAY